MLEDERRATLAIAAMVNAAVRVARSTGEDAASAAELGIAVNNVGAETCNALSSIGCKDELVDKVNELRAWAHTQAVGAKESVEDRIQDELKKEVHAANVLLGKLPILETSVPDFMKFMKPNKTGSMHREIISGMADSIEDLCKKAEQHEDDGTKDDRRDKRKAAQDLVAQLSSVVGIYAFIALLKNPGIKASNQGGKMLRENLFHIHVGFCTRRVRGAARRAFWMSRRRYSSLWVNRDRSCSKSP